MPIKIPDALPATAILESENIFVMTEYRALHQDIRPLKVLILNLMPTKIVTETQILRKLSNTPVQIQVELLRTASYQSQHTDEDHLASFYTTFDQVRDRNFDGMIITGAPVENLEFNQVDYWPELCEIMAWSRTHVHSTLHICWGAQAGLYFHHGIEKRSLPRKLFGVYEHRVLKPSSPCFAALTMCSVPPTPAIPRCGRRIFAPHRGWSCWPPPLRQESTLSRRRTAASSSSWDTPSMTRTP